jgi:hypothetical protein
MVKARRALDVGESWDLPLAGANITKCNAADAIEIEAAGVDGRYNVRIEGVAELRREGRTEQFADTHMRTFPCGEMIGQIIISAIASKNGTLTIRVASGSLLSVTRDERYEAWELSASTGLRIVSMPGGELAIWQPDANG